MSAHDAHNAYNAGCHAAIKHASALATAGKALPWAAAGTGLAAAGGGAAYMTGHSHGKRDADPVKRVARWADEQDVPGKARSAADAIERIMEMERQAAQMGLRV